MLSQIDSKTLNAVKNNQQNSIILSICSTPFAAQNRNQKISETKCASQKCSTKKKCRTKCAGHYIQHAQSVHKALQKVETYRRKNEN